MKTAALILAGGLSSRMGSDKGLLKQEGQYWVEIIQQLLPVDVECFISVGKHNIEAYKEAGFQNLILDKEDLGDFAGPIKGILSGLKVFQSYDRLLVLPCDMIHLDAETIKVLIHQTKTSCYKVATQIQPMPMLLTCDCLKSLSSQNLENISLKKFLELQRCEYVINGHPILFLNRNTPDKMIKHSSGIFSYDLYPTKLAYNRSNNGFVNEEVKDNCLQKILQFAERQDFKIGIDFTKPWEEIVGDDYYQVEYFFVGQLLSSNHLIDEKIGVNLFTESNNYRDYFSADQICNLTLIIEKE